MSQAVKSQSSSQCIFQLLQDYQSPRRILHAPTGGLVYSSQLLDTGGQAQIPKGVLHQPQHHTDVPGLVTGGVCLLVLLQYPQHHHEVPGLALEEGGGCGQAGLEPNSRSINS